MAAEWVVTGGGGTAEDKLACLLEAPAPSTVLLPLWLGEVTGVGLREWAEAGEVGAAGVSRPPEEYEGVLAVGRSRFCSRVRRVHAGSACVHGGRGGSG